MWTSENRPRYNRDKLRYPSDLTDDEWGHVEPLIPAAKRGGGKRRVDIRAVVNGGHVRAEHGMPMALPSEGFAGAQYGEPLLWLMELRRDAGSHSSRALRQVPRGD